MFEIECNGLRPRETRQVHFLEDFQPGIFDVERTRVYPLPGSFLAESGSPPVAVSYSPLDSEVVEWLKSKDLLTRTEKPLCRMSEAPVVTDISMDLGGGCNLACGYCFERDIQARSGPISKATAFKAIDFLLQASGQATQVALHFGSGEPLLSFALMQEVVSYAMEQSLAFGKQINFHLTTNGTLLTDRIVSFLMLYPFRIRISLDGPARYHDHHRPGPDGGLTSKKVLEGITLLPEGIKKNLIINTVFTMNMSLKGIYEWAMESGIQNLTLVKIAAPGYTPSPADHETFKADLGSVLKDIYNRLKQGEPTLNLLPLNDYIKLLLLPSPKSRYCGAGTTYLGISSQGDIYPCFRHLGLKDYWLGNVYEPQRLERGWYIENVAAPVDFRSGCKSCWVRYLCGGGCYADSVVYGKDGQKPVQGLCPFLETEIEAAISLYLRLREEDPGLILKLLGIQLGEF